MLSEGVMPPTPQRSSASPIICGGMLTDFGKGEPVCVLAYYGSRGPTKFAEAAARRRRRRRRNNEAQLHITSTKKYNSIDDKEDDEEIAKQLAKAIQVCLFEVPNKRRAATY
ncbi:hypothetical protein SUGI_0497860 [Cryptomeria japonica]|nr:hypothetical protein SUGI_0497860 [Cryptomeria japonica]